MKTSLKIAAMMFGFAIVLTSCECKMCRKEGENDVKVCRDNYDSQEDYNQAVGVYQALNYDCSVL